ncbi:MAG: ATP-binding protein [Candidatus Methylomirabilota bacterium]|nr:ATP-binding protein [candidate division NC10 bacterium]PWB45947.1 MAG: ATP-binding protein [candidate division NC10 bacterium]
MASTRRITLAISSDLQNVPLIGQTIRELCSLVPLSDIESHQIALCVVEAVNNAIVHAYDREAEHEVEVIFDQHADRLIVQICDAGRTMDSTCLTPQAGSPFDFDPKCVERLPERGLGLAIIRHTMDEVTYTTSQGKNILTLTRFLRSCQSRQGRLKE